MFGKHVTLILNGWVDDVLINLLRVLICAWVAGVVCYFIPVCLRLLVLVYLVYLGVCCWLFLLLVGCVIRLRFWCCFSNVVGGLIACDWSLLELVDCVDLGCVYYFVYFYFWWAFVVGLCLLVVVVYFVLRVITELFCLT